MWESPAVSPKAGNFAERCGLLRGKASKEGAQPSSTKYSRVPNRSAARLLDFKFFFPSYMLLLGAYMFVEFQKNSYLHDYIGLQFFPYLVIVG